MNTNIQFPHASYSKKTNYLVSSSLQILPTQRRRLQPTKRQGTAQHCFSPGDSNTVAIRRRLAKRSAAQHTRNPLLPGSTGGDNALKLQECGVFSSASHVIFLDNNTKLINTQTRWCNIQQQEMELISCCFLPLAQKSEGPLNHPLVKAESLSWDRTRDVAPALPQTSLLHYAPSPCSKACRYKTCLN